MAHLIASIGEDNYDRVSRIISSKMFDKVYLIENKSGPFSQELPQFEGIKTTLTTLDYTNASEDLVPELYIILKKHFMQDKVQDLDMAVNISCGTGKEHAVIISTLMKLGYGIRLVDLDKDGNILEMI